MSKTTARIFALTLFAGEVLVAGCGIAHQESASTLVPAARQGLVRGGQQPVTGATIQLYAVGTSGDGSVSTPLLSPAPTTDTNGGFSITGTYTCPSAGALVFIVATRGEPGLGSGSNNAALAMMTVLGPCGNLTSSTYIVINELTTVAAVYSLTPFMVSPSAIGSGTGDAAALASGFMLASELVNTSTGTAPGTSVPAGATVPVAQINLLGDILAGCVNSAGGTAGDGSYCGTLFTLTTPTTTPPIIAAADTFAALLHLANYPTLNTAALFNLASPTAPFQPIPSSTPLDLTVSLTYPVGLTVSPSSLNFGSLTTGVNSAIQAVTLTNNTAASVSVSAGFSGVDPSDFAISSTTCTGTLPGGSGCAYQIQFTPSAVGARAANFAVTDISMGNSTALVALSGTGTAVVHEVDLSWIAPSSSLDPIVGYNIYRSSVSSPSYQLLNSTADTGVIYIDTAVQSGLTYGYVVKSVDAQGVESVPSNQVNAVIP